MSPAYGGISQTKFEGAENVLLCVQPEGGSAKKNVNLTLSINGAETVGPSDMSQSPKMCANLFAVQR